MATLNPTERHIRAQIAAHESWGQTEDRTKRSQHGRDAFRDSFDEKADPEHKLSPAERRKRGESLYKAHFARMAFERAKKRRLEKSQDVTNAAPSGGVAVERLTVTTPRPTPLERGSRGRS